MKVRGETYYSSSKLKKQSVLHVTAAGYETDQLQDLIRCELIGVTQRVFTPRSQDVSCNILLVQPRREASGGVHASCLSRTLKYKKVCEVMVEVFYSITSSTQILKASPQNKQNTSPSNHNRSTIWQVMKCACNSGNFFFKGLNPLNQIKQLQQQYWWLHNGILGQRHAVVNRLVPLKWRVWWSCETKWIGSCFQESCQKHSLVLAS